MLGRTAVPRRRAMPAVVRLASKPVGGNDGVPDMGPVAILDSSSSGIS